LSGLNAHINRDLPVAVVQSYQALGGSPDRDDPRFADYERVNAILEGVEAQIKQDLAIGLIALVDAGAGSVDDVLAMWSVRATRDAAWTHSELLWHLRNLPFLRNEFLRTLDSFTGFAGRGLLQPLGLPG